jgi:Flp pilus assembly protein CpaB
MRLRRLTRSPFAFWLAVAALAVLTWSVVAGSLGRAQAQAHRFGSLRTAVIPARFVDRGAVVAPGDVTTKQLPAAFLPDGYESAAGAVAGRTAVSPLYPGQAVVHDQLAPDGLKGVAALLPSGTRAVAVPTGGATAPLRRGDLVDVLATFNSPNGEAPEPTFPVATGAMVVDVGADAATVAVSPDEAKRVAFAVTQGTVTLAIAPPGTQRTPVASSTSTTAATPTR